jgi:hypothetical protein
MAVKKNEVSAPKHYVLDTNVLLHDPQSMFQFENNVVHIPVEVLEELDRFKSESTTRGANAREVHRRLSERFRTTEQMKVGVRLENGGYLHIRINPKLKFDDHGWQLISESPRFAELRKALPGSHRQRQSHPGQRGLPRRHEQRPHNPRDEGYQHAVEGASAGGGGTGLPDGPR